MADFKDISLGTNAKDLVITDGDIQFLEEGEAIKQALRIRYRSFLGENFLNILYGLPYLKEDSEGRQIFGKGIDFGDIEDIYKEETFKRNGIKELKRFELDIDSQTRKAEIQLEAESTVGTVVFSEDI